MNCTNAAIDAVRSLKSQRNIKPSTHPEIFIRVQGAEAVALAALYEQCARDIADVAKCEQPKLLVNKDFPPGCAAKVVDQSTSVAMNLAGVVDTKEELAKLQKEIDNKQAYVKKLEDMMNNPNYGKKPPQAQQKDKDKHTEAAGVLAQLLEQHAQLSGTGASNASKATNSTSCADNAAIKPTMDKPLTPKKLAKKNKASASGASGSGVNLKVQKDGSVQVSLNYDVLASGAAGSAGNSLPTVNRHKMTKLHQAAQSGDVTTVVKFLASGADPEQAMEFDWTALHLAAVSNQVGVVQALIKNGCDLDAQTEDGLTALHLAASNGHHGLVSMLTQAGACPARRSRYGACPHDAAAAHGHKEAALASPQQYEPDADFDTKASIYYFEKPKWDLDNLCAPSASAPAVPVLTVPVIEKISFKPNAEAKASSEHFGSWYAGKCQVGTAKSAAVAKLKGATAPQTASPNTKANHISSQYGDVGEKKAGNEKKAGKDKKAGKKGDKKSDKKVDPEAEAKMTAKKLKAAIKEGGKKGVEIEGAADMGGLAFFCTTLMEPDGDMPMLEKAFEAMNADPPEDPEEERRGGAGGVGKMVFSAGAEYLQIICNMPKNLQQDFVRPDGEPLREAMSAVDWVNGVLAKMTKEAPGVKAEGNADFAKASIPGNKEKGIFALKIKDDAMAYAYSILQEKHCMTLGGDSSEGACHGDFECDDY